MSVAPAGPDGTPADAADTPPLRALLEVRTALERAGVPCTLGGSGLLCALGLRHGARDWDLTTGRSPHEVRAALDHFDHEVVGPNGIFATAAMFRVRHDGASLDVMSRFAIRHEAGVFVVPTEPAGSWCGVPLASPVAWAAAYRLMGRDDRARPLFDSLVTRGAPAEELARVLGLELPEAVRGWLKEIPCFFSSPAR